MPLNRSILSGRNFITTLNPSVPLWPNIYIVVVVREIGGAGGAHFREVVFLKLTGHLMVVSLGRYVLEQRLGGWGLVYWVWLVVGLLLYR